jgi:plasmid stabilization system protein ParE
MKYSFHPEAESEFENAIDYYEEKEQGLGYDFAVEVYSTIERILAHPRAWPIIEEDIRRSLVRRFPYGILYADAEEEIFIVAVMHLHRDPEYWKRRI